MRQADFRARIKKIEIANRTLSDGWTQAIRVLLDDIELTNENLLELKQFRPNEPIMVQITPLQITLSEPLSLSDESTDLAAFELIEGDPKALPPEAVAKEWHFG